MKKIFRKMVTAGLAAMLVLQTAGTVLAASPGEALKATGTTVISAAGKTAVLDKKVPGGSPIVILHTNDVHCSVDQKLDAQGNVTNIGYAGLASYKNRLEERFGKDNVILADAGDAVQGGNIGTLSQGGWVINIMNQIGYDVMVPGNHEFDYGFARFLDLKSMSAFPWLCSNLTTAADGKLLFPAYMIRQVGSTRIGFVGISTPESYTKSTPAYFQDAAGNILYSFQEDASGQKLYNAVQSAVDQARAAGADYVVAIAHLGEEGTTPQWKGSAVIRNTSGIDIMIDGHSHEEISEQIVNKLGKPVVHAETGTGLKDIGRIVISPADGTVTQELVKGYAIQDKNMYSYIQGIETQYKAAMAKSVGESSVLLTTKDPDTGKRRVRSGETNLGDLCADANRTVLNTDIGFMNGGGIRADINAGKITMENLLTVYPWGNDACIISTSGQTIMDALEFSARNYPAENGGFLQVSGMTYTVNAAVKSPVQVNDRNEFVSVNGARRVQNIKVNGAAIDPGKNYTIGGISYTLTNGGDGYTMFKGCPVIKDAVMKDYEVMEKYINTSLGGKVGAGYENPHGVGRIAVIG